MADWVSYSVVPGIVLALVLLAALFPYSALRLLMALLGRSLLWLRVQGRDKVLRDGPVLLVCNYLGPFGWLLVLAACPRRVRFLMLAGWAKRGLTGWLLRRAGAITPSSEDRAGVEQALSSAKHALLHGEVVCLFIEGCRTADGLEMLFSQQYRQLTAPVVPVAVLQSRGSLFALHQQRWFFRWPTQTPAPVSVGFGAVLPVGTSAGVVCQTVSELSAQLAVQRAPHSRPVHRQFVRMAARYPFRVCWIDSSAPGQDMTYARAYVGSVCLAELLRPIVGEAKMVAIWLPPGRGGALANVALALLGKVAINLNYTASVEAIQSALRQCECRHVLTARRFTSRLALDAGPNVTLVYLEDLLPKLGTWQKLRALLSVLLLPGWLLDYWILRLGKHRPEDLATVIFSSGSTGEPKGVMLTHANVTANTESMIQATNLCTRDRVLGVLPFFHSFGYTITLWAPLQVGATGVYHADPRQAREIGELCRKHRCTLYASTATFLRFCLKKCDPEDFRSLSIIMCGAEKLPPPLAEEFAARFGILPLEGYGCTELSPAAAANFPDERYGQLTQIHNKIGTVGLPLPGCACRIVHPDTGEPLPIGEEGLVLVTGANVMKGYLHKPELTAQVIRDGWYVTGDMGRLDDDGHVTLTGRLSRFAKIGGEMVPLERIEEALHDVLGTSDRVCAVTCVPDVARGERVVVLYVKAILETFNIEVRAWCKRLNGTALPTLWLPGERDFYAVPDLPLLGTGKVNLKGIKELALAILNGHKS